MWSTLLLSVYMAPENLSSLSPPRFSTPPYRLLSLTHPAAWVPMKCQVAPAHGGVVIARHSLAVNSNTGFTKSTAEFQARQ